MQQGGLFQRNCAATAAPDGTTTVTVASGPYTLVATKDNKAPAGGGDFQNIG